ncbi:MAG: S41 family peptidase, partial [Candidatus Peribacteraceae bacterium]|nr:S41 family peptidase [Candidatus Peribacteraceae bacterium]
VEVTDEPLNAVVQRIRGPKGTVVTLAVMRGNETALRIFEIKRDNITIPSVQNEVKKTASGSIGYIAVNQFGDGTITEVEKVLKGFKGENIKGIIVDLRYNGGGYLEGAVELASLFLKQGKIVTVQRRSGEPVHHYVNGRPLEPDIPLAVIINAGTASASEIFAGAMQDLKRGKIVGKLSFGKGTVQEVYDLPGGSSLRVTVAHWLTPNGKDLGKEGVHPDIDMDRTQEDMIAGRDPQLDAALNWLLDHEQPVSPEPSASVSSASSKAKSSKGLKEIPVEN